MNTINCVSINARWEREKETYYLDKVCFASLHIILLNFLKRKWLCEVAPREIERKIKEGFCSLQKLFRDWEKGKHFVFCDKMIQMQILDKQQRYVAFNKYYLSLIFY